MFLLGDKQLSRLEVCMTRQLGGVKAGTYDSLTQNTKGVRCSCVCGEEDKQEETSTEEQTRPNQEVPTSLRMFPPFVQI